MARGKSTVVLKPSRLSQALADFKKEPRAQLTKIQSLKLTYAFKNGSDWGMKHFVQEDLPRIKYANPRLEIELDKRAKAKEDTWKPELIAELRDGTKHAIDVEGKWSSQIFEQLMELGGGPVWEKWKAARQAEGLPLVEKPVPKTKPPPKAPCYLRPGKDDLAWRAAMRKAGKATKPTDFSATPKPSSIPNPFAVPEQSFLNPGKTGAAAILP